MAYTPRPKPIPAEAEKTVAKLVIDRIALLRARIRQNIPIPGYDSDDLARADGLVSYLNQELEQLLAGIFKPAHYVTMFSWCPHAVGRVDLQFLVFPDGEEHPLAKLIRTDCSSSLIYEIGTSIDAQEKGGPNMLSGITPSQTSSFQTRQIALKDLVPRINRDFLAEWNPRIESIYAILRYLNNFSDDARCAMLEMLPKLFLETEQDWTGIDLSDIMDPSWSAKFVQEIGDLRCI